MRDNEKNRYVGLGIFVFSGSYAFCFGIISDRKPSHVI